MKKIIIRTFLILGCLIVIFILYNVFLYLNGSCVSKGEAIETGEDVSPALLIIDIQEGTTGSLSSNESYILRSDSLINQVNFLIHQADSLDIPVVYIVQETTNWWLNIASHHALAKNHPGSQLDNRLKQVSNIIIPKKKMDAFSNPCLDFYLRERRINRLYVAGLDAAFCVKRTVLAAKNRGYEVFILENAVISQDTLKRNKAIEVFRTKGVEIVKELPR